MDERQNPTSATPRSIACIAIAALLLNLGLFPVLYILAPVVTGMIVGLVLKKPVHAVLDGFFPAFASYLIFFLIIATAPELHFQLADQLVAALLMGVAGGFGGLLGALIARILPRSLLT